METIKVVTVLLISLVVGATIANAENEINRIEISGLKYSNARVVIRELPFHEGEIWQPDFAAEGERRLRNLGLFSEAYIQPPDELGVVRIRVHDRWPLWVLPEATRSDRGSSSAGATLTYYNMWGLNHQLRLKTKWDTGTNFTANNGNSYDTSYIWRRVNDSKISLDIAYAGGRSLYDAYQNGQLASTYILDQQSWSGGMSYALGSIPGEGWDVRLGVSTNVSHYTLNAGALLPDIKDARRQQIQFSAGYQMADNRITWLTGTFFNYSLGISHKSLGSGINSYTQAVSYRRHIDIGNQRTFSYRLNAGLVTGNNLRDSLFDIGGSTGIRGYYAGELQGDAYLFGTVEGRYPLNEGSNFQLVAFSDFGHIRNNGKAALGKNIVAGFGAGMRWTLRWLINGTFRADYAYGTATHRWRAHVGVGQAF